MVNIIAGIVMVKDNTSQWPDISWQKWTKFLKFLVPGTSNFVYGRHWLVTWGTTQCIYVLSIGGLLITNLICAKNMINIATKPTPLCSPSSPLWNEPHFTVLAPLSLNVAYLTVLFILRLTKTHSGRTSWRINNMDQQANLRNSAARRVKSGLVYVERMVNTMVLVLWRYPLYLWQKAIISSKWYNFDGV